MERSLTHAFIERRNLCVMFERRFTKERRATAALGFYKDADTDLNTGTGVGVTGRITGAPILENDERRVLHLGTSITYRDPGSDGVRFSQRPGSSQAQVMADTGTLDADSDFRLGLELAGTMGSLSLQTETIFAHLEGVPGSDDPTFWSAYVMGSYILTGENRTYRERVGAFGTVLPDHPFPRLGNGALELAVAAPHGGVVVGQCQALAIRLRNLMYLSICGSALQGWVAGAATQCLGLDTEN